MANEHRDRIAPLSNLSDFEVADHDPDVRGWDVIAADGRKVGEVEDLIVDTSAMKVRYLDIEVDKDYRVDNDNRRILVPVGQARLHDNEDHVHVSSLSSTDVRGYPAHSGRFDRTYEDRVSRHLGASRQQLFETVDRPAMQPLPPEPFVHADWRRATVGIDYHVRLEGHHYSVPHDLIRQKLWARLTAGSVEIFRAGKRVACHRRAAPGDMGATTLNDHRPASHRRHAETTLEKLREGAARIGPATAILIDVILRDRPHPEQGFRSCLGILRLSRSYGPDRLEAACDRALAINTRTMASVKSILINRLDGRPPDRPPEASPITHANIRGAKFFH